MNKNDKIGKITLIIVIIIILTVLGAVGMIYVYYNKKIENAVNQYKCPVSIYDIVDGTKITPDMLAIKAYANVDMHTYICALIGGKCVKKNTIVKKNEMVKRTDLIDCEE